MSDEEVRVTSDTGGQKGQKLARFDLIPVQPLTEVARLYGRGASKYADRNWELGYAWSLSFAAMQRHAWAFWGGESADPENQRHHLASVVFHALALMEFELRQTGTDDRSNTRVADQVRDLMSPLEEAHQRLGNDMCVNCVTPWKCNGPHYAEAR